MEIHHLGSGICSQMRLMTGAIFKVTVPDTIIRSDCRGLGRKTSAPKRAMSKREVVEAIISMAQQARPNVNGHNADLRAQLKTRSTDSMMKGLSCLSAKGSIGPLAFRRCADVAVALPVRPEFYYIPRARAEKERVARHTRGGYWGARARTR